MGLFGSNPFLFLLNDWIKTSEFFVISSLLHPLSLNSNTSKIGIVPFLYKWVRSNLNLMFLGLKKIYRSRN
jgi:hypothetical protein